MAKHNRDDGDAYPPAEAHDRFVAALRGARAAGHKPMEDLPRKKAVAKRKTKKRSPKASA